MYSTEYSVLCFLAGVGHHNMHGDTPARHMRQEAHFLVDLAVLLYTMGLQITYQRLSAQVTLLTSPTMLPCG
jgi:hypothetical protein